MKPLLLLGALLLPVGSAALAYRATTDLPARISDSDGHRLRVRLAGSGSPTVVMEIGLAGILEEWATVQAGVAKFARVVAYDRAGGRYSNEALTGRRIAEELHAALLRAGASPPYILVGQSFGGVYNRIFASLYPREVVGMVLLDPSQERFIDWMEVHHPKEGLATFRTAHWPEAAGLRGSLDELGTSGPLPDVPVVVVTGARLGRDSLAREVMPVWIAMHDEWVKTLPRGRHVVTDRSGHGVQIDQPDLVVGLIRELVDSSGGPGPVAAEGRGPPR